MKSVLLIGLGRFGLNVAIKLHEMKHSVMAIDKNEARVNRAMEYVTNGQIGDCTNETYLEQLGISNYDLCIVAIGDSFQDSLEITSLLKDLGAKKVVSRACSAVQAKFLARNGADEVVYPERQMAIWTAITNASNHVFDYTAIAEGYAILEVAVPEAWRAKTVGNLNIRKKYSINILAIKQGQHLNMDINPGTIFPDDATLLVLGKNKDVQRCFRIS